MFFSPIFVKLTGDFFAEKIFSYKTHSYEILSAVQPGENTGPFSDCLKNKRRM